MRQVYTVVPDFHNKQIVVVLESQIDKNDGPEFSADFRMQLNGICINVIKGVVNKAIFSCERHEFDTCLKNAIHMITCTYDVSTWTMVPVMSVSEENWGIFI